MNISGISRRDPTTTRAFKRYVEKSLDNECVECFGTLHVWASEHKERSGRLALEQACVCLHCNARFTRILFVPVPSPVVEVLVGLALLLFVSLRVSVGRVASRVLSPIRRS